MLAVSIFREHLCRLQSFPKEQLLSRTTTGNLFVLGAKFCSVLLPQHTLYDVLLIINNHNTILDKPNLFFFLFLFLFATFHGEIKISIMLCETRLML